MHRSVWEPIICFRARCTKVHLLNDCKDSIGIWCIFIPCVTWADFNNAVNISSALQKQKHYFWLHTASPACQESCHCWKKKRQAKRADIWKKTIGYQNIYLGTQTSREELCLKLLSVKEHESGTVTMTLSALEESWDTGGQEV